MSLVKIYSDAYEQELIGHSDHISNYVRDTNTLWEGSICSIIVDHIKNNSEFVDIGANIGLITLGVNKIANERGKTVKCFHGFECDIDNFSCLKQNTDLLQNKVKIYPLLLQIKTNCV